VPAARLVEASVAVPLVSVPVPSGVVPSMKVTVPVGVPKLEEMVAVSVTEFCTRIALALVAIVATGKALFTVMLSVICGAAR